MFICHISLYLRKLLVAFIYYGFNGLDWSLLVKHLVIKDLVKQYNQELCISLIIYYGVIFNSEMNMDVTVRNTEWKITNNLIMCQF